MKFVIATAAAASCVALSVLFAPEHASEARASGAIGRGASAIVEGEARVIDGDTLIVAGQRIRLEGIDAPEINQLCAQSKTAGEGWPAGRIAAAALRRWVRGHQVRCRTVGRGGYGRLLGHCTAGGIDLNAAMIRQGLAWAFLKYSQTFVVDERKARAASIGVWSRSCVPAWVYRTSRWQGVAGRAPDGCAIKGNVTRNGRIYHMPWSPWYGRTRIDANKGERWFCDESQAIRAGWRPAIVQ